MEKEQKVSSQSFSFLATFIVISALRAVIGYISVYFFKPIWEWFWDKKSVNS